MLRWKCALACALGSISFASTLIAQEYDDAEKAPLPPSVHSVVQTSNDSAVGMATSSDQTPADTKSSIKSDDVGCSDGCCGGGGCSECTSGCDVCPDAITWHPHLYVRAEALFLDRDNASRDRAVVINDITEATIGTTRDVEFDNEVAPRLVLGYQVNECSAFELDYFGNLDWRGQQTYTGPGDLALAGNIALATFDFLSADRMILDYSSELHNFEVNFIKSYGDREESGELSWLTGFRYVNLREEFNINSTNALFGTSDYNVRSESELWGGQLGARFRRQYGRFGWDVTGKAGLYGNDSEQSTFLGDFDNQFIFRDFTETDSGVSFVGDINVSATYQLTRVWHARAGYNLMWVEGVALAPDQLDFTDTPTSGMFVDNDGSLFLHGASAGLEARW